MQLTSTFVEVTGEKLLGLFLLASLTVPCEKSKMASFASSAMKNVAVFPAQSIFPVKLICYNVSDPHQALVSYLNLLLSSYNIL